MLQMSGGGEKTEEKIRHQADGACEVRARPQGDRGALCHVRHPPTGETPRLQTSC
ncbi:hypothetical protein DPMN_122073 [Dreissena polymorpha]|uniref:Uncharacterized protein n=1 Tax=Dreissena polymorpha TaxID=45954 RepID=A0A9D4JU50_DREPO|nr:hypothetical protein DPMN_122073 [Dreissena polymorpha]